MSLPKTPRQWLLLDSFGALYSAFILGLVLVYFQAWIGMPVAVLYTLAAIAAALFVYSLLCFLLPIRNRRPFLRVVAIANVLYCLLTAGLVVYNFSSLTTLGIFYFIVEILVILTLARLEWRAAAINQR